MKKIKLLPLDWSIEHDTAYNCAKAILGTPTILGTPVQIWRAEDVQCEFVVRYYQEMSFAIVDILYIKFEKNNRPSCHFPRYVSNSLETAIAYCEKLSGENKKQIISSLVEDPGQFLFETYKLYNNKNKR